MISWKTVVKKDILFFKWINWSETAQKVLTIWLYILLTNSLFLLKDHIDLIHMRNFTWIQRTYYLCFRSRFQHKGSSSWIAISTEECFRCCGHWNTASENYREQGCSPSCSVPCTGHSVTICCCTTTENCQEQVEKATICHWWCRLPHQRNVLVTNSQPIKCNKVKDKNMLLAKNSLCSHAVTSIKTICFESEFDDPRLIKKLHCFSP